MVTLLLLAMLTTVARAHPDFGNALWIGATANAHDSLAGRSIVLMRTVRCGKPIREAKLNICGLGTYELYVNGRKVGDDILAPAWSDYDKTVFYNTIDLTGVLQHAAEANKKPATKGKKASQAGDNTIAVMLGNSFYHEQGLRYHKLKSNYGPLKLLFHLAIVYNDGSRETIESRSEEWKWVESPVVYNSIYGGEDYDARKEDTPPASKAALALRPPLGTLRPQIAAPVKIMERYPVARRLPGMVFDMGQNLAGFPEITVRGRRGQSVKLIVGETLTPDGHVNQKQTGRPYYLTYTLRGSREAAETWHPRFTYYGFRYIEVEGAVMTGDDNPEGLPVLECLQSCFIYNSAPKTGDFECSNRLFNDTYRLIDRAIRSNWQHVWTDCPHREKLGWLEQDWINGEGLVYNYDCRAMIEQTMQQLADAQHADGSMPEIAPEYIKFEGSWAKPFQESPEWGGALVALPFLYMRHYGDSSLVRRYYPAMRRYVDYLHSRDSAYVLRMGLGDWYDYGPGKAGFSKNTPVALVATAHYYRWVSLVQEAALIAGRADEAIMYGVIAERIMLAFQKEFFHPETASYGSGSQCSNAIPLELGIVPLEVKDRVMQHLVDDIHTHGTRLTTGDIGTRYLFNVLVQEGQGELLYRMLNHDEMPGYGFQLKQGMTTLAEQWNPELGASQNHFMMAHINNLLVPWLVGIRVSGRQVTVSPHPVGDLTWAKGSTTVNGKRVSVAWRIENGRFLLDITAPDRQNLHLDNETIDSFCALRHLQLECNIRTE